jgi:hypothetical protein
VKRRRKKKNHRKNNDNDIEKEVSLYLPVLSRNGVVADFDLRIDLVTGSGHDVLEFVDSFI